MFKYNWEERKRIYLRLLLSLTEEALVCIWRIEDEMRDKNKNDELVPWQTKNGWQLIGIYVLTYINKISLGTRRWWLSERSPNFIASSWLSANAWGGASLICRACKFHLILRKIPTSSVAHPNQWITITSLHKPNHISGHGCSGHDYYVSSRPWWHPINGLFLNLVALVGRGRSPVPRLPYTALPRLGCVSTNPVMTFCHTPLDKTILWPCPKNNNNNVITE